MDNEDDPFTPKKYIKSNKKISVFKSQIKLPTGPNLQSKVDSKRSRRHVKFMLSASGLTDITKMDVQMNNSYMDQLSEEEVVSSFDVQDYQPLAYEEQMVSLQQTLSQRPTPQPHLMVEDSSEQTDVIIQTPHGKGIKIEKIPQFQNENFQSLDEVMVQQVNIVQEPQMTTVKKKTQELSIEDQKSPSFNEQVPSEIEPSIQIEDQNPINFDYMEQDLSIQSKRYDSVPMVKQTVRSSSKLVSNRTKTESELDIFESQGACQSHQSLTLPPNIENPDSGTPSILSKSKRSKNQQLVESLGEGGSTGLQKLNDFMQQELESLNQLQKLFKYIESSHKLKEKYRIDNLSKIVRNFPDPEILNLFIHQFRIFHDLPEYIRKQILSNLEPVKYGLQENVGNGADGMYLVCDGEVVSIKTQKMYQSYMDIKQDFTKEREIKSTVSQNLKFGDIAQIGWVITSFLLKNEQIQTYINKGLDRQKLSDIMDNFGIENLIEKGEIFGDLSQLKGKNYQAPYSIISMHPNTEILFLSKEKLKAILTVDPENFRIIKKYIPQITVNSMMIQKKICRNFENVEFYPGQLIYQQGDEPKHIYFIKQGVCGVFVSIDSFPQKLYEISANEWIGDEFVLTDKVGNRHSNIEYGTYSTSAYARTLIKALKISCLDFRKKIPKEFIKEMKTLSREKIEFVESRLEITRQSVEEMKQVDEQSKPFSKTNNSIKQMYPYIPQKMVNSIGFGDGKFRKRHHFRCQDTIKIGEISLNEDLILLDENVPLSQRYKKFGPENVRNVQQFKLDLTKAKVKVGEEIEKMQQRKRSKRSPPSEKAEKGPEISPEKNEEKTPIKSGRTASLKNESLSPRDYQSRDQHFPVAFFRKPIQKSFDFKSSKLSNINLVTENTLTPMTIIRDQSSIGFSPSGSKVGQQLNLIPTEEDSRSTQNSNNMIKLELLKNRQKQILSSELPSIQTHFCAIPKFQSGNDLRDIEIFLDRDLNQSEMLLSKENRRKYYEYLKFFQKGKKVDKMQMLVDFEMRDPVGFSKLIQLKQIRDQTLLRLDKWQIQYRKQYRVATQKSGFEEDFDPSSARNVLTSRFGQFVTEKRSQSQPRAMILQGGRTTKFGRERTPKRKVRIVESEKPPQEESKIAPEISPRMIKKEIPWRQRSVGTMKGSTQQHSLTSSQGMQNMISIFMKSASQYNSPPGMARAESPHSRATMSVMSPMILYKPSLQEQIDPQSPGVNSITQKLKMVRARKQELFKNKI